MNSEGEIHYHTCLLIAAYFLLLNGASSKGRTQAFGACRGGSIPPAPVGQGIGYRE
jgi:hypothetical protein